MNKKIFMVLVLGLALVGSCFAKKAKLYDDELRRFNALCLTVENPVYITDLPEDMIYRVNSGYETVDGNNFTYFGLCIDKKDFVTEERPVILIAEDVEYDSDGCVTTYITIMSYENENYEGRKILRTYFLQCYSLDTWMGVEGTIKHLQDNPDVRMVAK